MSARPVQPLSRSRAPRTGRRAGALFVLLPALVLIAGASRPANAVPKPDLDVTSADRAPAAVLAELDRLRLDPALARVATPKHIDERFGVPSFVIGTPGPETQAAPGATPEQAARRNLARLAPYYRLDAVDVQSAPLRYVNDSGQGGIVAVFRQEVDGIPVFRDEMKVLLDRKLGLLAVAGSIPPRAMAAMHVFRIDVSDAIAAALSDLSGSPVNKSAVRRISALQGGYEAFAAVGVPAARLASAPFRARRVFFRTAEQLVPAYHIELTTEDDAPTYVIAADDGRVLLRHDRVAFDAFNYRVWAETGGLGLPHDGPQGTAPSPHPTGTPNNYYPPFIPPSLVSLQNGPISTNDPWLAPGATTTSGNNVDAYADLTAPDGYSAGDLRATTTSAGTFERTYDVNQEPDASANQKMAGVTQLFYTNNFLHDWFYDVGFNEAAGNAQLSNLGRGGIAGDPILAEGQDYSGTNNANMSTPADGASPRMQTYLWNPAPLKQVTVNSPASVAGAKSYSTVFNTATAFNVTANLALPFPGTFSATSSTLAAGSGPRWVQIADVSGDGHPDLVVANSSSNNLSVMLSDGSGGFLAPTSYSTGNTPRMVVTPDLNHDGLPDLVSANLSGSISVRLGTGGGAFGATTLITSGSGANSLAVGRFDADANDDVVVTNSAANTISVFLGDGAGGFLPKVTYPMGFSTYSVAIGDLNHDGFADLVTAGLSINNFISVRLGTGTGTFGAVASYTVGNTPESVALADLNGDGNLDAVTADNAGNTVSVAFGNGLGGFGAAVAYAVPASPVSVAANDFNGDGLIDVIVSCNPAGSVSLLANDGAGVLGPPQTLAVGTNPFGVQLGDVNGDHQPDILTANSGSSNVTILTGTVTPSASVCPPFANTLTGRIAFVHRGTCTFPSKINEAQARGAVGVVIDNNQAGLLPDMSPLGIPGVTLLQSDGNAIRAALNTGPVNFTIASTPSLRRDSALDNLIVAHEWAHYLSNRLIGDGSGLLDPQSRGMGEGWSDFNALLMAARAEDAGVASNPNWSGTFTANGFAVASTAVADNSFYFGIRRYPYSTDFAKNPLTFKHISDTVPLPVGPPMLNVNASNSEVHCTGEVWCNMLWECYASLLRDTGRLSFTQARDRMRRYFVQSLQLTPARPTFTEARDALLMAAYATDVADYQNFCAAFARRGMGTGAVAPPLSQGNNYSVVESFVLGGDLSIASFGLDDSLVSCDHDGYLDTNEEGRLSLTLQNPIASVDLGSTTATFTSSNPNLQFPSGNVLSLPASHPGATTTAGLHVRAVGSGIQTYDVQVQYNDPGLLVPGPRSSLLLVRGNVDEIPSANDEFEAMNSPWTTLEAGSGWKLARPWQRTRPVADSTNHVYFCDDASGYADESLVSPPLVVGGGNFSFTFQHAYSFLGFGGSNYHGGVVEISTDGGADWTDVGSAITPGYGGTIAAGSNALAGRAAFVVQSPGYPARITATANLGTAYAGQTVKIRFRLGTDSGGFGGGWTIDSLAFTGITNTPFMALVADPTPCSPVAVSDPQPATELAFTLAGPNPSRRYPTFRFALPQAGSVTISVYDVGGRRLATLANGTYSAGVHNATWTAAGGSAGRKPGVYFARMVVDGKVLDRRVVVLAD